MKVLRTRRSALGAAAGFAGMIALAACGGNTADSSAAAAPTASGPVELNFYYPVAVGGPITKILDGYAADFNKANPNIKVTATFAGGYADVLTKIQTSLEGGSAPPEAAVLLSTDLYSLKDADYIVPLDPFLKSAGDTFATDFYDAFMANSKAYGQTWGIPFQRSTPVLYYNKDLFKEAGLNPDQAPKTWAEMVDAAKKLNKPDQRWGIEIPSDGFPYWLFQGVAIGNGKNVVGDAANKVTFNDPAVAQALQAWVNLGAQDKTAPNSIVVWATTPSDFTGGKAAMIWHTTGSLTNILKDATFPVGVGFLPGLKQNGAPTGGGNFYLFKKSPAPKQQAAWKFIQYLATPELEGRWTIDTGYVAPRKSAWDAQPLKDYAAKTPQVIVARDQLKYAAKELTGHSGAELQKILGNGVQAALTGKKAPQQALDDAQKEAEKLLSQFKD